jgi:hypothetical protein
LSFVLHYPELLAEADDGLRSCGEEPLQAQDLNRPEDQAILTAWREWLRQGGSAEVKGPFYDTLDAQLQERIDVLIQVKEGEPPAPDDLLRDKVLDAITQLRLRNLVLRNRELYFLQHDAEASEDREAIREYGRLTMEIAVRKRRLELALNRRSLTGRRQQEDSLVRVPSGAG